MGLDKNADAENLEEGKALLWTYAKKEGQAREDEGKMLRYDVHKTLGWDGFFTFRGTFLSDGQIWRTCFGYWLVAGLIAVTFYEIHRRHSKYRVSDEHMEAIRMVAAYSTTLLGFMLSLFVSNMVKRWWTMRKEA